jgi:tellurite resistance protein TerA
VLLRRGEGVRLPITEIRLEFRRGTGPGIPRAELYALLPGGGEGADGGSGAAEPVSAADPLHRSGAVGHSRVRLPDGVAVDTLTVRLASLGAAVGAVRFVVRAEGGPAGRIPHLRLQALAEGRQPARLDCSGLVPGRTVVVGECYREGGGWLLRALYETAPAPPAARAPAPAEEPPASGTPLGGGLLRVGFTPLPGPGPDAGRADLCALVELADGRKGVVQPLGAAHGSLRTPPYVRLDAAAGELAVDLDQAPRLRRVLVFLALRAGCFTRTAGTVSVRPGEGPPLDFDLAPAAAPSTACALLLLTARGGRLHLRREAHHLPARPGLSPQRTADYAYGWGLRWAAAPSGP